CSQGRHGIAETKLMKCHDVQIPLHHNHTINSTNSFFCLIKTIQRRTLTEQRRFHGVDIFGQALVEDASAEADNFSSPVDSREHQWRKEVFMEVLSIPRADYPKAHCILDRGFFST